MGWSTYADMGRVYEISAVFDDHLKKDTDFTNFAVMVANRILEDKGFPCLATYGKWGCRIDPNVNPGLSDAQIEFLAGVIERHLSWVSLKMATWVFTYGEHNQKVSDYQNQAEERAKAAEEAGEAYLKEKMQPAASDNNNINEVKKNE